MRRVLARILNQTLLGAIERWRGKVAERNAKQAEEERKQALFRRIAAKIFHKCLSGAFEKWSEIVEQARAEREAAAREEQRRQSIMKRML